MSGTRLPAGAAAAVGWIGCGLIGAAVASFSADTPFPGTAALLPTTGALLLIAAGAHPSRYAPGRLLSTSVPRFFGRISYSLYLWSWPLLAVPAGAIDALLPLSTRLTIVALTIPLAAITQHLVEQPLRLGRFIGTVPGRNLALAAALSLGTVAVSLATYEWGRMLLGPEGAAATADLSDALVPLASGPLPADVRPALATARNDSARSYRDNCHLGTLETHGAECAYGVRDSPRTVVLLGDSHAANWLPALERIAATRGWRLLTRTKSACSPADVPVFNDSVKREYTECATWRDGVLHELETTPPFLVVISGSRRLKVMAAGAVIDGPERERAWAAGLDRTIRRLTALGVQVAIIADTPRPASDVPTCLSGHVDDVHACVTPRSQAVDEHWRALERTMATNTGAIFVDPTDWVCPTDPCPAVISSRMVFRDNHHLSTPFAELLSLAARVPPASLGKLCTSSFAARSVSVSVSLSELRRDMARHA